MVADLPYNSYHTLSSISESHGSPKSNFTALNRRIGITFSFNQNIHFGDSKDEHTPVVPVFYETYFQLYQIKWLIIVFKQVIAEQPVRRDLMKNQFFVSLKLIIIKLKLTMGGISMNIM